MVVELRPTGATKGDALKAFMTEPEFIGARPLFMGDDLTDEHGFAAAADSGRRRHIGRAGAGERGALPARLGGRCRALAGGRGAMSDLDLWPIGNCQVSALADGAAGLVWACQPRVDGDPMFCSLLDPKGRRAHPSPRGEWRIALENQVSAEPRYLKNTPILATRLTDADGAVAEVFDFCPRFERSGRMYRPVAFIRIVRPLAGTPRVKVSLNPAADWGGRDAERTSGTNHIRFLLDPQPMRLTTDAPVTAPARGAQLPARGSRSISSSGRTSPSSATSTRRWR